MKSIKTKIIVSILYVPYLPFSLEFMSLVCVSDIKSGGGTGAGIEVPE